MVGTALCKILDKHELIVPGSYQLNVANEGQVMKFAKDKPDFIIHLAAETDHEYAEINPAECYMVNSVGTGNMVALAKKLNVPILYLSAGSIFDGSKLKPYERTDSPDPMNHYNKSKWYGELIVRQYKKHYIVRAGWMFGGGPSVDKKFVNKIMQKIHRGEKKIKVCDDCVGSPVYTDDLALWVDELIKTSRAFGTYHCVNSGGGASRYVFANWIVKILKLRKVEIVPCPIDALKEEFPCKRTNYEVLEGDFAYLMRDWRKALTEYINAYYRN